ncbi:nuclear pore complex protein Nup107-like [Acropora muricata]|uniref:nuclear pore complex protein Nup107-like n=1 Tax=Acropora muricata TaxID=159855 RepID=UPI0034E53CF5
MEATDKTGSSEMIEMFGPIPAEDTKVRDENRSNTLKRRSHIKRSLHLLDESMATPRMPLHTASSLLRKANTPSPLRQLPLSSMVGALSETEFDLTSEHGSYLSEGLGPLSSQLPPISMLGSLSFMETGGSGQPLIPNEPLTPHNAQDFALRSTEDLSQFTGNVTVSFAKDPLDADSSRLYEEFMNAMTSSPDTQQIFDVIANYQKACREHRRRLNRLIRQTTPEKTKFSHQVDIEDLISQESYTWRLIGSLYSDRLQNGTSDEEVVLPEFVGKHWSEKTIVEKLYELEASTRQSQIVIDWLEKNAEDWLEIFLEAETVEYFSESVYWENTLHALKQGGGNLGRRRPLVTEMDPDAPGRQNRPLHDLDQEDETRLLRHMFTFIRAGKLKEAQDLCERSNQYWRAASLEGWKLWHDPNMNGGLENTALAATEGNENRDLWKKCCWGLCEKSNYSIYEKAIYAALCGNLSKLLPVCRSWEDYLWAFFKVMVDVRVEQVIRLHARAGNPLENLPPEFWDQNLNPEKIFEEIGACPVESVRRHSNDFHHVIQRHIILNDTNGLIEKMYSWLQKEEKPMPQIVRFMAHLVLFLKSAGIESETDPDHCVAILKAYVQVLIDEKQIDLVATYTATLPPEIQTRTYAYFLEGIDDTKQRQKCLDLADSVGLDVPLITKTVVENIRGKEDFKIDGGISSSLEAVTSKDDRKKIEAIEWLMFHRSQRSEALKQSNAIIRCFIATRKHAAAREVFQKIPPDSIDVIHKQWEITGGSTALPPGDDNAIKEYLCIRAYLEAMDGFDYWFQHFHQSVPLKPRHEEYTNFTEKVAFEQRLKDYEVEFGRWKNSLDIHTKVTVEKLYNVLLFPDGGWMVDQGEEEEEDSSRKHQLQLLRQLCLPLICFLLHKVLHSTEQYKQCVKIADVIASEQYQLYKVFRKDELQKMLSLLRDTSLEALGKNLDPLGYDMEHK